MPQPPKKRIKSNPASGKAGVDSKQTSAPTAPAALPAAGAAAAAATATAAPKPAASALRGSSASVAVTAPVMRKAGVKVVDATAAIETFNAEVQAARAVKQQKKLDRIARATGAAPAVTTATAAAVPNDLFRRPKSPAATAAAATAAAGSESDRFHITAKQIKELGTSTLYGRHKRTHEREKLLAMGAAPPRAPVVPRAIATGIWKANNAREDSKRERDRALGLSVAPKRKRTAPGTAERDDGLKITPGSYKNGVLTVRNKHIKSIRDEQSSAAATKSLGKFMKRR